MERRQEPLFSLLINVIVLTGSILSSTPVAAQSQLPERSTDKPELLSQDDFNPALLDDAAEDDFDALLRLAENDVEQLSHVQVAAPAFEEVVSTVSRKESTVGKSPAAVFVITNAMIRRSGVRSIPEALRMAPGVQVARISSSKWAISVRGFGGRFTNKLLVQIDGRSVYTPLFAGVFWDVQDVLLEDVERIEVIRGPGATVWGANAVNGVINVITKKAEDTQGGFVESGGGTERAFTSARLGMQIGENAWMRVYGKWFERDDAGLASQGNRSGYDDWRQGRGGFRIDWLPEDNTRVTLQGDIYDGTAGLNETFPGPFPTLLNETVYDNKVAGGNLLARVSRSIDEDTGWDLQFYFDRVERVSTSVPQSQ